MLESVSPEQAELLAKLAYWKVGILGWRIGVVTCIVFILTCLVFSAWVIKHWEV